MRISDWSSDVCSSDLHFGISLLIAAYGIWRLRSAWKWLLAVYPAAMGLGLVYFGEHYVVDLIGGGVLVAVVMIGKIGRASCRERVFSTCRSRWSPYH